MKTIRHSPVDSEYEQVVSINRIVYLSKSDDDTADITLIHLDNGEVLKSEDSMNTIEARMNRDER